MRDEQETPSVLCRPLTGRVVIATHNSGKLAEMRELLAPFQIEAISAREMGLDEPEETGTSFSENARIKACAAALASGLPAFADDSGLVVEALDGAPGIHSARWAGPDRNFSRAMGEIERRDHTGKPQGAFRLDAVSRLAGWPRRRIRRPRRRHTGLAAARRQGIRLRSDFSSWRLRAHLRRDDERGETRVAAEGIRSLASCPRLSQARGGLS